MYYKQLDKIVRDVWSRVTLDTTGKLSSFIDNWINTCVKEKLLIIFSIELNFLTKNCRCHLLVDHTLLFKKLVLSLVSPVCSDWGLAPNLTNAGHYAELPWINCWLELKPAPTAFAHYNFVRFIRLASFIHRSFRKLNTSTLIIVNVPLGSKTSWWKSL